MTDKTRGGVCEEKRRAIGTGKEHANARSGGLSGGDT